jgi:hypothetical protein
MYHDRCRQRIDVVQFSSIGLLSQANGAISYQKDNNICSNVITGERLSGEGASLDKSFCIFVAVIATQHK